MQRRGLSQRRACTLLCLARSTARYQRRPREAEGEGEGLAVPRPLKKKRGAQPKQERPLPATRPNQVWTVDFLEDRTVSGQKLRVLTITDECTRESLAIEIAARMPATAVAATVSRVIAERGVAPGYLRSDNGLEFMAGALRGFLHQQGVATAYIERGSPWQNGLAESFHSRLRDEFLNAEVFLSVVEDQVRAGIWRCWYNEERPHGRLGYQRPREFTARWRAEHAQATGTNMLVGT
jgi:putative transposase